MCLTSRLLRLVPLLAICAVPVDADWPLYQADGARSAVCEDTLDVPLHAIWRFTPPQPPAPA